MDATVGCIEKGDTDISCPEFDTYIGGDTNGEDAIEDRPSSQGSFFLVRPGFTLFACAMFVAIPVLARTRDGTGL